MKRFNLPDLGEGLQEAEIVDWHVAVGDRVVADQPLVSVETDKAVVEIPAPWAGMILRLHGASGDRVAVGAPLVEFEAEGENRPEDGGSVVGTLPREHRVTAAARGQAAESGVSAGGRITASPAVRRRAAELGVDLAGILGTGPGGSVTSDDVDAAVQAAAEPPTAGVLALRCVRRAMAEAMARSGSQVVPAGVTDEAIIDAWPAGADPTIRLIRAIVAGCRAAPSLNAWFDAAQVALTQHQTIDLGIAMETADGLFVPVLRDVANRSDADLRAGLEAMKRDVSARTVPRSELIGQTITLSNFGMLGGLHATLAVMPPQVAILGAGRLHEAPRVKAGEIRVVRIMPLSLTFDHRALTGAEAIHFLNAVKRSLSQEQADLE